MPTQAVRMGRHQLAVVEDLHRLRGDPCLDRLAQQLEGHRIVVPFDLDMIIEIDPAALPFGILEMCRGQLLQRGPIDLLVEGSPVRAPTAHQTVVQLHQQRVDGAVQLGQ